MGAVNFLNQDNNSQAFQRVAELTATQKRDDQVVTMTSEMRLQKQTSPNEQAASAGQGVFNPFSSNVPEEEDEPQKSGSASPHSKED